MLDIKNLHASVDNKPILNGVTLKVARGEVHAIMGPNGSGKSTLSHVLTGRAGYKVTAGEVLLDGEDLLAMSVEARAHKGVFLAMQYPVELQGVNNMIFMREAFNALRRSRNEDELDAVGFMRLLRKKAASLQLDESLLKRSVNAGFSGGEKKRNEILQMAVLEPSLCILDETDSGLDIDAMRIIANGVNALRTPERSMILVTHYQRLLDYIEPDQVHVMFDGCIVRSGDKHLAQELEDKGYGWISGGAVA